MISSQAVLLTQKGVIKRGKLGNSLDMEVLMGKSTRKGGLFSATFDYLRVNPTSGCSFFVPQVSSDSSETQV